jgi:thiazole synthase
MSPLRIADRTFASRLLTGTGKYASAAQLRAVLDASGAEVVTMAIKRVRFGAKDDGILSALDPQKHLILPNTSGVRTAKEAIFAAELAREALGTSWLKLEIHPDPKYLMPDPVETLEACRELVKKGFTVLPYIHADPVLAKRLEEVGAAAVMPLGAPIGSNQGLVTREFLAIIIKPAFPLAKVLDILCYGRVLIAAIWHLGYYALFGKLAHAGLLLPDVLAHETGHLPDLAAALAVILSLQPCHR